MHRFFVPPNRIAGDAVTLPGDVSHQLRRVLRARAGDKMDTAQTNGLMPVTLGKRVLRAETSGLVVASAILYELGELGGRKATLGLPIDELIANGELTSGLLTKSLAM